MLIRQGTSCDFEKIKQIAIDAWRPIYEDYKKILGTDIYDAFYHDWESKKTNGIIDL